MIPAYLPTPTTETKPFWDGCAHQELRYQYCARCNHAQFPPRSCCANCQGALEWRLSKKKGTIHSITQVHRAPTPAFRAIAPYLLALVDLDEGFRMMVNVQTESPNAVKIGTVVAIVFEMKSESIWLPQATVQKI